MDFTAVLDRPHRQFERVGHRLASNALNATRKEYSSDNRRPEEVEPRFERYLLVVSLLSFLGILSCLGVSIYGFVGVMDPDTFVSDYTLKEHESNIHYWLSVGQTFQGNRNRQTDLYPKPSEEELAPPASRKLGGLPRRRATSTAGSLRSWAVQGCCRVLWFSSRTGDSAGNCGGRFP